jgi:hypothetical protein
LSTKAKYVEITADLPSVPIQRMMSSITANLDDQMAAGGLPNTPITPRRKAESAAGCNISEMLSLPSTPAGKKELVPMPLVVKDNGALVVEIEQVNVKLDEVISEVAKIKEIIMLGVAEVDSSVPVPLTPPVPVVDLAVTHTLMIRQYDEMRRVMAGEQEKMRDYMKKWAIMMAVFVFLMTIVVVSHVHVTVYTLKEPVVCESHAEALPTVYDNMMCCARVFAKDSY